MLGFCLRNAPNSSIDDIHTASRTRVLGQHGETLRSTCTIVHLNRVAQCVLMDETRLESQICVCFIDHVGLLWSLQRWRDLQIDSPAW